MRHWHIWALLGALMGMTGLYSNVHAQELPERIVTIQAGGCLYGDAAGLSFGAGFLQSLDKWAGMFVPGFHGLSKRLLAGVSLTADMVPLRFYYYAVSPELTAGYLLSLYDFIKNGFPLTFMPFISAGAPVIVAGAADGSAADGGFMARLGVRMAMAVVPGLDLGVTADYRMVFSFLYIGSFGVAAAAGWTF